MIVVGCRDTSIDVTFGKISLLIPGLIKNKAEYEKNSIHGLSTLYT
jgi:hypothetical protein